MLNLLLFLIVIGILVFVHEAGHFLAAKLSNIQVDEFALGFGPKIAAFKKGETEYRINLLPFGGYVKMAGEGDYEQTDPNPRGFEVQVWYKKLIVVLAGVIMNVILASVIYTGFMITSHYTQYVPQVVPNHFPFGHASQMISFAGDPSDTSSPIEKAHLNGEYIFQSINTMPVTTLAQVQEIVGANKGKELTIVLTDTNGNHKQTVTLIPRQNPPKGRGSLGIILSPVVKLSFTGGQKPVSGVLYAADMLQYNVSALVTLAKEAVKTKTASVITQNLTGPVGIYEVTGTIFSLYGVAGLLNIIALLSLALALMNVLPLPVLDGGFAVIIIIEAIIRRPISAKVKNIIGNVGIGFLILLMILVTYNDIINFNIVQQIGHLFKH